jgi:hypothetical protein
VRGLRTDVVILACAISAGIHAALVPEHWDETKGAGVGFAVSALLLAALMVVLTLRPASRLALAGAALVFIGLVISYVLAVTTGVPVLHPEVEPVEGLAIFTKLVEVVGLAAALSLLRMERKTTWTTSALRVRFHSF